MSPSRRRSPSFTRSCSGIGQGREAGPGAAVPILAAEEDLREGHARWRADEVRTRLVEGAQLGFGWLGGADRIVEEEGHLLRQPAADDGVADVEFQRPRLAGEHLFLQMIRDETC